MTASAYGRLTPRMAWQLAAPHTWPAAILPVLVAAAAAAVTSFSISATMVCVLLVICVLMQSAVNTFNDYYDYVKGADSADDNVDPTDAVLVYNNVNPRAALALAVGFLAAAFLLGAYVIWIAGWIPLAIGAAGAVVVVLYSAGKTPISYLPIGELVSGFVMGGLIPLACYQALSGTFDLRALLWAVPTILGVGLIMFTNNTCDVEKDVESGRRTLSVLLGRERARKLYHGVVYAWVAAIVALVAAFFTNGLLVMPFMLLASYPLLKALLGNPLARTSHWARSTRRPSWQAASRSRSSGRNGIPWKRPSRRGCSDSGRSTSLEARRRELPKHRARTTHRARDPSAFGTSRVTWWSEGPCMPYTSKDVKTTRRETPPRAAATMRQRRRTPLARNKGECGWRSLVWF